MFKGLTGLKKAVKGGFSVVAEHSSQLAEQVVGDPSTSKEHLKESIKKKVSSVVDATETVISAEGTVQAKDKAVEVVHNIKHYGAFGEDYLGYSDPTKDLRKAVKQKEKAAKKAKKANKKLKGKKEDLFDPENLAKYKREIEQRRLEKEAALASAQEPEEGDKDSVHSSPQSEKDDEKLKFTLDLAPDTPKGPSGVASPITPAKTPKEETEDWKLFQSLTAGVDSLILQKKSELEDIKQESYFQKKQITEKETEEQLKDKKSKKKWIDLDKAGFDDFDGEISGEEAAEELKSDEQEVKVEPQDEEPKEEKEKNPEGYVDIPEDEPIDLEAEDDLFNTAFVEALSDIKLAVIPDDITYDDDPFNTGFADEIVKKDKEEKRREASRIKFTGLSSVADVLTGKADKVDKDLVEVTVKQKRRRANRINLIAEDATDITSRDKIGTFDPDKTTEQTDILADLVTSEIPVGDLLSSVESSKVSIPVVNQKEENKNRLLDLAEFDELPGENQGASLTSNVAILAGEFATAFQEEEDDFDAAFDALAHESVTKSKLDQLEKDFADEDVFDTTAIDGILNLVSLANKVEESVLSPLETFEDKDPFDTSAYDDIACVLEEELGFESLAKRDPKDGEVVVENGPGADVFGGSTNIEPQSESGWAAFKEDKPARPPPPKPKPGVPRRPPQVQINPSSRPNTPSVVVKAPSTESIKSWNISVAETLIKKSELEALEAEVLAEREEEEFDPFDTTNFASEEAKEETGSVHDIEDPFDTSEIPDFEKEERLKREEEEEARRKAQVDLLTDDKDVGGEIDLVPIIPEKGPEPDPFDTGFAARVLPNKGDPFDTSFVTGCPGKAEIQALEEEFIDREEFDPRTLEGSSIPRKVVAPGTAGRARPKKGLNTDLVVKAPVEPSKPVEQTTSEFEDEEEDPFDTSIVNKVIPVQKTTKRSEVSVEDDDFDPTSNFQRTKKEEIDPFDTTIAVVAVPELAPEVQSVQQPIPLEVCVEEPKPVPVAEPVVEPKVLELDGKTFKILPPAPPRRPSPIKRQISDEEFDPRA